MCVYVCMYVCTYVCMYKQCEYTQMGLLAHALRILRFSNFFEGDINVYLHQKCFVKIYRSVNA